MKKHLVISAGAMVCCASAIAQSSVTIYGSLGDSIAYSSNEHGSHRVFMGGGTTPEWLGFTGTEDLGGGLKALFKLEEGIVTASGSSTIPGEMFSRQSYVGLQSNYGKITLGRQFDITNEMIMPLASGYNTTIYQLYHIANVDDLGSTFFNNGIKYTSPDYRGFTTSVMYGFDDPSTQPGRYLGAGVTYNNGPLRAAFVYSAVHDRAIAFNSKVGYTEFAGETLIPGGNFIAESQESMHAFGMYTFNQSWMVHAGYSHVHFVAQSGTTENMDVGEGGVNWHTSVFNVIAGAVSYQRVNDTNYYTAGLSDVYFLSKSTQLFVSAVYQHTTGQGNAAMAMLAPSSTHSQFAAYMGTQLFF
jgi:predicted porin